MDPKIIIIITITYLYGFFEVILNLRQKKKKQGLNSREKKSLWMLYGLITMGYFLAFTIGATKIGRIYSWNAFFAIGMVLFAAGLLIRLRSMATLKQYFTYAISKTEEQKIVDTGFYKTIRHPGYLGQLILFLGISISMSNWLSILAMMIPIVFGYAYRIRVEERFMVEQFGSYYLDYQKRTKKIIPFIY